MNNICMENQINETKNGICKKKLDKSSSNKINILLEKLPILGQIFDLHCKIGEGTFSNVYLASSKYENENGVKDKFAVKHLIPTCHPSRIVRELKCLQEIGGVDNVSGVFMCLRMNDCVTFIMPYQPHDKFNSYVEDMGVEETQLYLKQLLIALRRVHRFGVIHRDVKPSNFLYNRKEKKFLLVDFGLAQKIGEGNLENGEHYGEKNKKRKRNDEEENQEPTTDMPPFKRQTLQNISTNHSFTSNKGVETVMSVKRAPLATREANITFINNNQHQFKYGISTPTTTTNKYLSTRPHFRSPATALFNIASKCNCDGKPQICHKCLTRKAQTAPRAGTPGFRPPEVLLKYQHQTTAVDMWAVGVIMLCILSRTYPFFRSPDDVTALAEMITLFGSEQIKLIANKLGRNIICSEMRKPINLKLQCEQLSEKKGGSKEKFPDSAFCLMSKLLELDPSRRISAEQALQHPFFNN